MILAAAIKYYIEGTGKEVILCGARHGDIFTQLETLGFEPRKGYKEIAQGFIDHKNNFLTREEANGITYVEQEESYTSKASFWDKDTIPVYSINNNNNYKFSGERIQRGLYRTSSGKTLNADVNGALNILKKSSVVDMNILYSRGEVDTPVRIRVA